MQTSCIKWGFLMNASVRSSEMPPTKDCSLSRRRNGLKLTRQDMCYNYIVLLNRLKVIEIGLSQMHCSIKLQKSNSYKLTLKVLFMSADNCEELSQSK